jgi:CheY-like chemotaxis protein
MFQASDFAGASVCLDTTSDQGVDSVKGRTHIPTVLAVDDDEDSLYLLSHILEQFTCTLICETHGTQALSLIETLQPDLVLLDIWLPGVSGLEIVRAIRQNAALRSLPVVAVTALASAKDRESIFAAGFNQYLSKPYGLEDMEALLGAYLLRNAKE